MQASNKLLNFIAYWERPGGKPALTAQKSIEDNHYEIGFGHLSDSFFEVKPDTKINWDFAYTLLAHDVGEASGLVNRWMHAQGLELIDQNKFDALVDAVYNGVSIKSGVFNAAARGDTEAVCLELKRWVYATVGGKKVVLRGLQKRRNAECAMYALADYGHRP